MLTQAQLAAYHHNGVLLVENAADEATLSTTRRALADLISKSASVTTHNDIYDLEPTTPPQTRACAESRPLTYIIQSSANSSQASRSSAS